MRQTESALLRVKSQNSTKSPVTTQTAALAILSLIFIAKVSNHQKIRTSCTSCILVFTISC
jgi:hypothetical protein